MATMGRFKTGADIGSYGLGAADKIAGGGMMQSEMSGAAEANPLMAVGMKLGELALAGFGAQARKEDVERGIASTWGIYEMQKGFLEKQLAQGKKEIGLQFKAGQTESNIGMGAIMGRERKKLSESIRKGGGIAVSGEGETASERAMAKISESYAGNQRDLWTTRQLSTDKLELQYEKQDAELQRQREEKLAEFSGITTTFEGGAMEALGLGF